ncbi:MAG: glycosyltransferase family 2 protein [Betaproteobacteria bacterium]|nr:glycosyltransferase family 2 protein [Betaproteobacteria bacterium]
MPPPRVVTLPTLPIVSVLIVNFNSGAWLARCVDSVLANDFPLEILVGDNGSSDDSIAQLTARHGQRTGCRIFFNGCNLGFATASNRLLAASRGEFLLLLNPDCTIAPNTLAAMIAEFRRHPGAGMAGCLIRNLDGSEQRGCRRRIPTLESALYRSLPLASYARRSAGDLNFDLTGTPLPAAPCDVEAISGAFMLVSRQAFETVGPMDEGYFLHCEDLDWCLRFTRAGLRILFVPNVEIAHGQGVCSAARPLRVEWHKHRGMQYFYRKFYGANNPPLEVLMTNLAIWAHFAVACARRLLPGSARHHKTPPAL